MNKYEVKYRLITALINMVTMGLLFITIVVLMNIANVIEFAINGPDGFFMVLGYSTMSVCGMMILLKWGIALYNEISAMRTWIKLYNLCEKEAK